MPSPVLAITPGEPAGIGPDLCVQVAQRHWPVPLVAVADPGLLEARAALLGLPLQIQLVLSDPPTKAAMAETLYVAPIELRAACRPGQLDTRNATYVLEALDTAIDGCLSGRFAALVTGPVHKGVINDAGIPFTGHTEFLAERSAGHPVMLLSCPGLRVALATTHLPLRAVADSITPGLLEQVLRILEHDLRVRFGVERPRILVSGLNPHAGENGYLGHEEVEVIGPVIERLRAEGLLLTGPLPADTLFTQANLAHGDAVLAMYHDQGLPILKHLGFGEAVNITLGLSLVRTSVDHGTALDLAGSGDADPGSLTAAIEQALAITAQGD